MVTVPTSVGLTNERFDHHAILRISSPHHPPPELFQNHQGSSLNSISTIRLRLRKICFSTMPSGIQYSQNYTASATVRVHPLTELRTYSKSDLISEMSFQNTSHCQISAETVKKFSSHRYLKFRPMCLMSTIMTS